MGQIFSDEKIQASFDKNGFVKIPCLNREEVRQLSEFYDSLHTDQSFEGFHCSMFHSEFDYKNTISQRLIELAKDKLKDVLPDYKPLYGNFMVKESGPAGEFKLHQDWSYVDEDQFTSLAIWIPLIDLDESNGCLHFVSGTQNINNTHRGPGVHFPYTKLMPTLMEKHLTSVPMKAGEAVIWDHRVLHYSTANMGEKTRVAATMILVPKQAEVFHYYRNDAEPADAVHTFKVDHDFFMNYKVGKEPVAEKVRTESYWFPEVQEDHLKPTQDKKPSRWKWLRSLTEVFQNS